MLVEPGQRKLVGLLVSLLHTVLRQVPTRGHEAMNLVVEGVDLVGHFQVLLEA